MKRYSLQGLVSDSDIESRVESNDEHEAEIEQQSTVVSSKLAGTRTSGIVRSQTQDLTHSSDEEESGTVRHKKVKVQEYWKPSVKPNHCEAGRSYLTRNSGLREIFDAYFELQEQTSGSKWKGICLCCGKSRVGAISRLLEHFTSKECSLSRVPNGKLEGLVDQLQSLGEKRLAKHARNIETAKLARQPDPNDIRTQNVGQWIHSAKYRQTALLQETAKFFIGNNLPASMGDSPFYRTLIYKISAGKISMNEMEIINSRQLGKEMCRYSEEKRMESYHAWEGYASQYGGTLLVDGWTAKRTIGTVGVCVAALTMFHVLPLLLSGTDRSRASDYADKLETAVAWTFVFFVCTDGASNMILLGEDLQESKSILPCLCAAHGFSLTVHYIAKVFETKTSVFSKVAGIVAYFNRSRQRMALLREKFKSDICFIKFCKTRMAYQTLALLRALRLRQAAQEAMIQLRKVKINEDDIIDAFSKTAQVAASLDDDNLWRDVELFCRVSLPVLYAMREVDRGTPMAGFVYWLHYHVESQVGQIMEKLIEADETYEELAEKLKEAIVFVWDKRHRPVLSFAYLTNPLFYADLSKEEDVFGIDTNFRSDIDDVLITMAKKRYSDHDVKDILTKVVDVKGELSAYLKPGVMTKMNEHESQTCLAADFWTTSSICDRFPNLAWYARRVHAMPVVTSRLERFFSHVGNVQSDRRASLGAQKAALFAATHQQLLDSKKTTPHVDMQAELLKLVQRCEDLQTESDLTKFEQTPGLCDLSQWLEEVKSKRLELLYKRARRAEAAASVPDIGDAAGVDSESEESEDVDEDAASLNSSEPRVLLELDCQYQESNGLRRSKRTSKPLNRLNI